MAAKPAEGGQKAHGILGLQHAADQIKRPLDLFLQIGDGARYGRRAMRIVAAIEPDLGVVRRDPPPAARGSGAAAAPAIRRCAGLVRSRHPSPQFAVRHGAAPAMATRGIFDLMAADQFRQRQIEQSRLDPHRPCGHVPGGRRNPGRTRRPARPARSARRRMTSRGISSCGPTTSGTRGLMMPAFSAAMAASVVARGIPDDPVRPAG